MSGKGIHVLKKRLKEKSDALKQCEEDVDKIVKERRHDSKSFLASQGEIITEVVQQFDQLAGVLTRKRDEILLHLKEKMKEIHASSSTSECEDLHERLKKVCLAVYGLFSTSIDTVYEGRGKGGSISWWNGGNSLTHHSFTLEFASRMVLF